MLYEIQIAETVYLRHILLVDAENKHQAKTNALTFVQGECEPTIQHILDEREPTLQYIHRKEDGGEGFDVISCRQAELSADGYGYTLKESNNE